jgi:hypothetical protein
VHREHKHTHVGTGGAELGEQVYAIAIWQRQIQQQNVGLVLRHTGKDFFAAAPPLDAVTCSCRRVRSACA